jgi:hypothetical protein
MLNSHTMKKYFLLLVLGLFYTTILSAQQPNVLLIIADDMGNDAIEGFGVTFLIFQTLLI